MRIVITIEDGGRVSRRSVRLPDEPPTNRDEPDYTPVGASAFQLGERVKVRGAFVHEEVPDAEVRGVFYWTTDYKPVDPPALGTVEYSIGQHIFVRLDRDAGLYKCEPFRGDVGRFL